MPANPLSILELMRVTEGTDARGARGLSQRPIDDIKTDWSPTEKDARPRRLTRNRPRGRRSADC